MTELHPSEIRYSQATISTVFDTKSKHSKKPIEDTLAEICEGKKTISDIPSITVCQYKDQWYTIDNRRLWVFKHLEALEKCSKITVNKTERSSVPNKKFTTSNDGISVGFRTPFAPDPSGYWYIKAKNAMNDKLTLLSLKSGKEADSPVCESKTNTISESEIIVSNSQDSDEDINSDLESSNSNISGVGIPKRQEDSVIQSCSPDNVDNSSLDPLDECNDSADRKDAMNGKLQSDDVSTSNDAETGKMHFPFDEPSPSAEVDRDNNSNHNTTSSSQRQRSDQVNQLDQGQSQNDKDFASHTQQSIQDQNFNQQLKVSQKRNRQIQDEEEIIGNVGHENSPKRSRADVE